MIFLQIRLFTLQASQTGDTHHMSTPTAASDVSYDLRISDAAKMSRASEPQIRHAIRQGKLPHARIGKIIYLNSGDVSGMFGRA
jgi:hypothetical protein